jgi:hypothetical protein
MTRSEPRFEIIDDIAHVGFTLLYDVSSLGIEAVPRPSHVGITLQVKYLQLYMSVTGDILFADGFLPLRATEGTGDTPLQVTRCTSDTPPKAALGCLLVLEADEIIDTGITHAIGGSDDWEVSITDDREWIAMRRQPPVGGVLRTVQFARPCIAVLASDILIELWLHVDDLSGALEQL